MPGLMRVLIPSQKSKRRTKNLNANSSLPTENEGVPQKPDDTLFCDSRITSCDYKQKKGFVLQGEHLNSSEVMLTHLNNNNNPEKTCNQHCTKEVKRTCSCRGKRQRNTGMMQRKANSCKGKLSSQRSDKRTKSKSPTPSSSHSSSSSLLTVSPQPSPGTYIPTPIMKWPYAPSRDNKSSMSSVSSSCCRPPPNRTILKNDGRYIISVSRDEHVISDETGASHLVGKHEVDKFVYEKADFDKSLVTQKNSLESYPKAPDNRLILSEQSLKQPPRYHADPPPEYSDPPDYYAIV